MMTRMKKLWLPVMLLVVASGLSAIGIGGAFDIGNEQGFYMLTGYSTLTKWHADVIFDTNVTDTTAVNHRFALGMGRRTMFYESDIEGLDEEQFDMYSLFYTLYFPVSSADRNCISVGPTLLLEYQNGDKSEYIRDDDQDVTRRQWSHTYGMGMGISVGYTYLLSAWSALNAEMVWYGQTMHGVRHLEDVSDAGSPSDTVSYFTISSTLLLRFSLMFTMFE